MKFVHKVHVVNKKLFQHTFNEQNDGLARKVNRIVLLFPTYGNKSRNYLSMNVSETAEVLVTRSWSPM
jgi:hypothetical protein